MEDIKQYINIARLICKKRLFKLNESEARLLDAWRQDSEVKERVFQNLRDISPDDLGRRYERADVDERWEYFKKKRSGRQKRIMWSVGAAASVCLLMTAALGYWMQRPVEKDVLSVETEQPNSVRLVLSTGETMNVSAEPEKVLALNEGTKLYVEGHLKYVHDSVPVKELQYNELIVPRGTFFHLVLSDGTKVWLNADSRIKYPVAFGEDKRQVELQGEGYFEVAKEKDRPFVVSTDRMDVRVLGTTFDVNTYEDQGKVFVVLKEGLVEVLAEGNESRIITPGQMASLNVFDLGAGIQVEKCDVEAYTAWKQGSYSFRNMPLTEMLKQVSRYYDVTIVYEDGFEEEYYTGDISRDISLESLLSVIENSTSVSFKLERKTVYIQKKRD